MNHSLLALLLTFGMFLSRPLQAQNCPEARKNAEFAKGTWIGKFTQYSCGVYATYPMTIEITEVKGKKFFGFFIWKDLPNAPTSKTTLRGVLKGNTMLLYEDALLSGGGLVLNGIYKIEIVDCTSLKGNWRIKKVQPDCDDPQAVKDGGSFTIRKLVPHVKEEEKPASEQRKVVVRDQLEAASDYVTIKIWDNGQEDGDIITLRLNGQVAIDQLTVTKEPHEVILPLTQKRNIIELYAENVGSIPPNTATIVVISGGRVIKQLVLESDMNKSEAIRIIKG